MRNESRFWLPFASETAIDLYGTIRRRPITYIAKPDLVGQRRIQVDTCIAFIRSVSGKVNTCILNSLNSSEDAVTQCEDKRTVRSNLTYNVGAASLGLFDAYSIRRPDEECTEGF